LSRCDSKGYKGSRLACLGHGFKGSNEMLKNYKEQKDMEERQPWITLGCFTYLMVLFANWKHRY
jgi:hypothetical protein